MGEDLLLYNIIMLICLSLKENIGNIIISKTVDLRKLKDDTSINDHYDCE